MRGRVAMFSAVWPQVVRFGVAGLLFYAAWPKLVDPAGFAVAISHYRLLPGPLVIQAAWVLPWLEALVAFSLCGPRRWRAGGWCWATGLFALFAVAQASAWWRGLDITCGCFGGEEKVGAASAGLRLMLAAATALAWRADARSD